MNLEGPRLVELRDYLRILRRRWPLIVACLVITVPLAGLITLKTTPQYQATSQIFVSTNSSSSSDAYQGSLFSTQRVASYADLVTGKELAQRVIERRGTRPDARGAVGEGATPPPSRRPCSSTSRSPIPTRPPPNSSLRPTARNSPTWSPSWRRPPGKDNPVLKATIVDSANLPTSPVSPRPLRNLGLAAVLGLLLGFGIAVSREILDTTVKTADDVAHVAHAAIMAGIAYDPETRKRPWSAR